MHKMHVQLPYYMILVHNQPVSMQEMQEVHEIKSLKLLKLEKTRKKISYLVLIFEKEGENL
jgi:hypothetical protein